MTTNACIDYWRKYQRRRELSLHELSSQQVAWLEGYGTSSPAIEVDRYEQSELLQFLLSVLGPEDRVLISLVYTEGKTLEEAAEQLSWGLSKTKRRVLNAKSLMQTHVKNIISDF